MAAITRATESKTESLRALLNKDGVDAAIVAPSSDFLYLTGYGGHPSERPNLLVVPPNQDAFVLVARLESSRFAGRLGLRAVTYEESDDPYGTLERELQLRDRPSVIAVSDQMWAAVVLSLQSTFPQGRFVSASSWLRQLRMVKSEEELEVLSRAAHMADAAFRRLVERRFIGRTEQDIASELTCFLRDEGLKDAGWGPIVASGPHGASPHHTTGDRVIQQGDAIVLDFGGELDGYQADMTRTVHAGSPAEKFLQAYSAVSVAQESGVRAVEAGAEAQAIDMAARSVIEASGLGPYFIHRTGHGIGLDDHEDPYIIVGNQQILRPGMTFSVEPGVYLPGEFGIRIEDIVALTEDGVKRLNEAPRDLIVVS